MPVGLVSTSTLSLSTSTSNSTSTPTSIINPAATQAHPTSTPYTTTCTGACSIILPLFLAVLVLCFALGIYLSRQHRYRPSRNLLPTSTASTAAPPHSTTILDRKAVSTVSARSSLSLSKPTDVVNAPVPTHAERVRAWFQRPCSSVYSSDNRQESMVETRPVSKRGSVWRRSEVMDVETGKGEDDRVRGEERKRGMEEGQESVEREVESSQMALEQ